MIYIVGLGNPEAEYFRTRHNAGFMAIDMLMKRHGATRIHHDAGYVLAHIAESVIVIKPMSGMNISGHPIMDIYASRGKPKRMLVIHDDVNLSFGALKLREAPHASRHNGVASIQRVVGKNFTRLRVGIGMPQDGSTLLKYVLSAFTLEEWSKMDKILTNAAIKAEEWAGFVNKPKPKPKMSLLKKVQLWTGGKRPDWLK